MISEIMLGVPLIGAVGTCIWLFKRAANAGDAAADARVSQVQTQAHLERAQFEADALRTALANSERRADALEGVIADEVARDPNPDLARNDVRGRLLRFSQATRPSAGATDPGAAADLSPTAAATSPRAAELPAGSATVR